MVDDCDEWAGGVDSAGATCISGEMLVSKSSICSVNDMNLPSSGIETLDLVDDGLGEGGAVRFSVCDCFS